MTDNISISLKGIKDFTKFRTDLGTLSRNLPLWNFSKLTVALWYYFFKHCDNKKFIETLKKVYKMEDGKH